MAEINANPSNTFTVDHNQFSTWTDDEYKVLLGYKDMEIDAPMGDLDWTIADPEVDWRNKNAVTDIKN